MEDLKDIILGTNLIWEGNLEDSDDTEVKIYFKIVDLEYIDSVYKISVEIDKISASQNGYGYHINGFCNSGKDVISDREYLQMISGIISVIKDKFSQFGDINVVIKSLNCSDIPQDINEQKIHRRPIRNAVRDIVRVFKNNDDGVYYLPEFLGDDMVYFHPKMDIDYTVELELVSNVDMTEVYVDGNYYPKEEVLEITVTYNPDNKFELVSELIGELNELIAHEFTHMRQNFKGQINKAKEPSEPFKYYSQEHELEAQTKGFRRKSKITKTPFNDVVDKWFEKYKEFHKLNDDEMREIKQKIKSGKY